MSSQPYRVVAINAFNDNYIWLIISNDSHCVVVDPGDAQPVLDYITEHQLTLEAVLITHHHHDHVGGVATLLQHVGRQLPVYGPATEASDVVTHPLVQGSIVELLSVASTIKVLDVPGHTLGHIAYVTPTSVFCGDTLFSAGCGRMFEGTPKMFQQSLAQLSALPAATKVYCAHEYTLANLAFAKAVSPACDAVQSRIEEVTKLRQQGRPSIPTTIGIEQRTNPFLRLDSPQIQQAIAQYSDHQCHKNPIENFAALRRWKDQF